VIVVSTAQAGKHSPQDKKTGSSPGGLPISKRPRGLIDRTQGQFLSARPAHKIDVSLGTFTASGIAAKNSQICGLQAINF
jgi:hypothetical protein